jgi:hypothetical protein
MPGLRKPTDPLHLPRRYQFSVTRDIHRITSFHFLRLRIFPAPGAHQGSPSSLSFNRPGASSSLFAPGPSLSRAPRKTSFHFNDRQLGQMKLRPPLRSLSLLRPSPSPAQRPTPQYLGELSRSPRNNYKSELFAALALVSSLGVWN